MSELLDQVRKDALNLSEKDRAGLAHDLLTSLEPEDPGAEEAWEQEIIKRVARIRSGQEQGHPAEIVFEEIRGKLGKGKI